MLVFIVFCMDLSELATLASDMSFDYCIVFTSNGTRVSASGLLWPTGILLSSIT